MDKKILAIIPARGGSKGIVGKNIKELNGKPLIAYTIEEAKKSEYINRIVVSTDNEGIANISKKYGAEVPFLRPLELAQDDTPTIECVIHMLNVLKENEDYIPDYVCLLQCTSPLRTFNDIDGTIEKLLSTGLDSAASVCEAEVNPYWTNIFNGERLEYFFKDGKEITRRQDLPNVYRLNGAVYVAKCDVLKNEMTFETEYTTGYVMDKNSSIDIDDIIDFKFAELLMKE
ncbi:acylneuraminate cytidylyltransferase family protein [Clostridium butyricum]|uniref:acylneuraminate cytidylyltransferase family protein n=1 Tax=Clostridium butyricum TaxID=1492 RepID=UPI00168B202E|nr:acylneuraminate cytidylyltransferase family protein [Clostridium butyricum]MDB2153568.1 acylneuraminate cytidylyltransferase family protein [Clostridium butyricum]